MTGHTVQGKFVGLREASRRAIGGSPIQRSSLFYLFLGAIGDLLTGFGDY
jgi:hypothetical protein